MPVLYVRDKNTGEFVAIPAIVGPQGPPGPSGDGAGDMLVSVFDPAGKSRQLAADNEVVHNMGDEVISGVKRFLDPPEIPFFDSLSGDQHYLPAKTGTIAHVDQIDTTITDRIATQPQAAAGTDNTRMMTPLRSKQAATKFIHDSAAALIPAISGNSTTRDLTVLAGSNPNRLTILLTSGTGPTSASTIRLRVSGGSYYNIVMPSGVGTDNIKSLSMWVPYDLILVNISGTLRWVCLNYFDTLSRADKKTELGIGKTLWSGTWSSGTIILSELENYFIYAVRATSDALVLCTRTGGEIIGIGGQGSSSATQTYFRCGYSGTTLDWKVCQSVAHLPAEGHGSATTRSVTEIIGVL